MHTTGSFGRQSLISNGLGPGAILASYSVARCCGIALCSAIMLRTTNRTGTFFLLHRGAKPNLVGTLGFTRHLDSGEVKYRLHVGSTTWPVDPPRTLNFCRHKVTKFSTNLEARTLQFEHS